MLIQELESPLQLFGLENADLRASFILSVTKDILMSDSSSSYYSSSTSLCTDITVEFSFSFQIGDLAVRESSAEILNHVFSHPNLDEHYLLPCPIPAYLQRDPEMKILSLTVKIGPLWTISVVKRIAPIQNPYRIGEETRVVIPVNEETVKETLEHLFDEKHPNAAVQRGRSDKCTTEMETILEDTMADHCVHDRLPATPVGIFWTDEKAWKRMNQGDSDSRCFFHTNSDSDSITDLPKHVNLAFLKARITTRAAGRHDNEAGFIPLPHRRTNMNYIIPQLFNLDQACLTNYLKRSVMEASLKHAPSLPKLSHYILGAYHVTTTFQKLNWRGEGESSHPAFDVSHYAPLARYYGLLPSASSYEAKELTFCNGRLVRYIFYDGEGQVQEEGGGGGKRSSGGGGQESVEVPRPNAELQDLKDILSQQRELQLHVSSQINNTSALGDDDSDNLKKKISEVLYQSVRGILRKLPIIVNFTPRLERIIQHDAFHGQGAIYSGPWTSSSTGDEKITTAVSRYYFQKPLSSISIPFIP
jgi:hypothetical protein